MANLDRPRVHNHRDLYVLPSSLTEAAEDTTKARARRVVTVSAVRGGWTAQEMLEVLHMLGLAGDPPPKRPVAGTVDRA